MSQAVAEKPGQAAIEEVMRRIDQISTLPQVAVQVMKVANDPNATASDLKETMECDVALSARVLRCVNSSAYALRTKITNLQQAVTYLGMKQIRNLAMTASVSQLFHQDEAVGYYRRIGLWRHLVSVGLAARLIAMRVKVANFEDIFLAGLLHDIGIVIEDQYAHEPFTAAMQALQPAKSLAEVERKYLEFDHTQLGERVSQTWGFPEPIQVAIRHHHTTTLYQGEHVNSLRCVDVANLLCSLKGIPSVGLPLVRVCQTSISGLSLTKQDLTVLGEDISREIEQNSSLFQV
jgi:putative nucleotidyltransferase with HDIG domain